jgi:hypothetical protein
VRLSLSVHLAGPGDNTQQKATGAEPRDNRRRRSHEGTIIEKPCHHVLTAGPFVAGLMRKTVFTVNHL